jgi:hypothetical protein
MRGRFRGATVLLSMLTICGAAFRPWKASTTRSPQQLSNSCSFSTCSFPPHISHPLEVLTEQLVSGVPGLVKQRRGRKHVSMTLTCVINTRQLSDVTASPRIMHHATVSSRTGQLNLLQLHAHECVASGSQFLFLQQLDGFESPFLRQSLIRLDAARRV